MKKFKDFIYDKNDIIIALLILVVAALVIFWRLNIILEYPKQLLGNDDPGASTTVDNGGEDGQGGGSQGDDSQEGVQDNDGTGTADGNGTDDGSGTGDSQEMPLWQGGVLTRDVEVEVTGNSATAAIQCLIDEGLFDDYADYQQVCTDSGLDHEKVRAGTFTFEKGSTKKDIAKKMNWG